MKLYCEAIRLLMQARNFHVIQLREWSSLMSVGNFLNGGGFTGFSTMQWLHHQSALLRIDQDLLLLQAIAEESETFKTLENA